MGIGLPQVNDVVLDSFNQGLSALWNGYHYDAGGHWPVTAVLCPSLLVGPKEEGRWRQPDPADT